MLKSPHRKPTLEFKKKIIRRSTSTQKNETEKSRVKNDPTGTSRQPKNTNDTRNELLTLKAAPKQAERRTSRSQIDMPPRSNNNQDSVDDNDADDEEDPPNSNEDTELSDNEEIDHPHKMVQYTDKFDESNDELDVESDVQVENKGDRQMKTKDGMSLCKRKIMVMTNRKRKKMVMTKRKMKKTVMTKRKRKKMVMTKRKRKKMVMTKMKKTMRKKTQIV